MEVMAPLAGRALTAVATFVTGFGVVLGVLEADSAAALACLAGLVAAGVGWVVVRHEPSSAVGPALAWSSAAVAGVLVIEMVAASSYGSSPLPGAGLASAVWVGLWPLHLGGVILLLLVFPDGRLPARRWLLVLAAYLAGTAATVASSWGAREVGGVVVGGPTGGWVVPVAVAGLAVVGASLVAAVLTVAARYRAGDGRRREQIRWLMLAGGVTVGLLLLGWGVDALGAPLALSYSPFLVGVVVLVPVSVGVAIVRHDLYDIDRLLGATASWALTLVGSALVFAVVVVVTSWVIDVGTGWAPATAAFVTALTLLPLQRHLATVVGRLVDRDRFVAVAGVEQFAADVRAGTRAPEEIEQVLRAAQRDPALRLLLARPGKPWTDVAGNEEADPAGIGVRAGGAEIARIVLGRDSARARRRIAALAHAGWVPIEVSRLRLALREAVAETEASRRRLAEATTRERKRLERDLHDGIQPRLVATGMRLRSLQQHGLTPEQGADIDIAVAELEATVAEVRHLAHGIRPSRLDDGLGAALESLRTECPLPLEVTIGDLPELDDTRAVTAYYVVSEAVANALKHAQASRIDVRVHAHADALTVEVRDDGMGGLSADALTGMRDRVQSLGGRLGIVSPPGDGTTVRAML
jgi:signal transduction histidine kinase